MNGRFLFRLICTLQFLLLAISEYLIRNNDLVGIRVEIPSYETIIFELGVACIDGFLEQNPPGIFFIGEQLADCFAIPFGFTRGGGNASDFQRLGNLAKAVTAEVTLEDPADNGCHRS